MVKKTKDRVQAIVDMRREKRPVNEIARKLGISANYVYKLLKNEKYRLEIEMEEQRTAQARESAARFDVVKETEGLVRLHMRAAKEEPMNKSVGGMAYTGLRLLAQLRGEITEKRETRTRVEHADEWTDEDEGVYQRLLAEEMELNGGNNGNGRNDG